MNSQEFIEKALKTEYEPEKLPMSKQTLSLALLLGINCGNVMDLIKKNMIYGKQIDSNLMEIYLSAVKNYATFLQIALNHEKKESGACGNDDVNIRLLHAAIGMFTESSELLQALLDQLDREGASIDAVNFAEELGDVDWYKAIAINELGISEEKIRETVIAKLAIRYPQKFTSEAALNRNLDREREVLEQYNGKFPQGVLQTDSAMLQGE